MFVSIWGHETSLVETSDNSFRDTHTFKCCCWTGGVWSEKHRFVFQLGSERKCVTAVSLEVIIHLHAWRTSDSDRWASLPWTLWLTEYNDTGFQNITARIFLLHFSVLSSQKGLKRVDVALSSASAHFSSLPPFLLMVLNGMCLTRGKGDIWKLKGTRRRSFIFLQLHWLIYISEMCHWRNIHKLRPNQSRL